MKKIALLIAITSLTASSFAETMPDHQEVIQLKQKTHELEHKLARLERQLNHKTTRTDDLAPPLAVPAAPSRTIIPSAKHVILAHPSDTAQKSYHNAPVSIHAVDGDPDTLSVYPTALISDGKVVAYIAGTPVISSPYLGARPAFDGSDYIVNISSINRDIRLLQQRRRLYSIYEEMGYPIPNTPIISLSGKLEPYAMLTHPYFGDTTGDIGLGSSELDITAALNSYVEGYMGFAFDSAPPLNNSERIANSRIALNLGFINIGNLAVTPLYFTAGQLYAPFGKYSSAMISAPLPQLLARTKTRPVIFGYKSQGDQGPYLAGYAFKSDTIVGRSGVGGVNLGYAIEKGPIIADVGAGFTGSLSDSDGIQITEAVSTTFGGFASRRHGSEIVSKIPGLNFHGNISYDSYNLIAEWVGATTAFRPQDLSFDGQGAKPQAGQLEANTTFTIFDKPATIGAGYQWTREALALNLPKQRIAAVFNISIWKDTIESLEYRHDIDYKAYQYANGAAPVGVINANTLGSGRDSDTITAQIGIYF